MKITKLGSATVIIESNGISILCDPWLIDGIYYGSWCNFPPIPVKDLNFDNIEIGALLSFARKPDIYRIDIHTLLNSLHV